MPFDLSVEAAGVVQGFGFGLPGGVWVGVEGDKRIADDELAFWAAGAMSFGRDWSALGR